MARRRPRPPASPVERFPLRPEAHRLAEAWLGTACRWCTGQEEDARQQGSREELAHGDGFDGELPLLELRLLPRVRHHVRQDDEQGRGRNDLSLGAGGAYRSRSEARVVAAAEHGRLRDQSHGDHGRSDDAGGGRQ